MDTGLVRRMVCLCQSRSFRWLPLLLLPTAEGGQAEYRAQHKAAALIHCVKAALCYQRRLRTIEDR